MWAAYRLEMCRIEDAISSRSFLTRQTNACSKAWVSSSVGPAAASGIGGAVGPFAAMRLRLADVEEAGEDEEVTARQEIAAIARGAAGQVLSCRGHMKHIET